jgi:membrane protein DedA with SNARE-associated domain
VRFAVNVMMGVSRYPYPKFLLFSVIGGSAWAGYTCVFSFWIGQALKGYPVLSILMSVVVTTAIVALLYFPLKRRYETARNSPAAA